MQYNDVLRDCRRKNAAVLHYFIVMKISVFYFTILYILFQGGKEKFLQVLKIFLAGLLPFCNCIICKILL